MLEERLGVAEPTREMIADARKMIVEIHKAGTSAKDLTRHLLAFSRLQVFQPVFLDLNATVNRLDTMLGRLIGDDIELVSVLRSDLGTIKADPIQLEQVLMNLAVNSRDAMPQGGRITIETANVEIDETYVRQNPSAKPGPYVMLAVSDTGVGMDKETQSRIFEPFFSTKRARQRYRARLVHRLRHRQAEWRRYRRLQRAWSWNNIQNLFPSIRRSAGGHSEGGGEAITRRVRDNPPG